MHRSGGKVYDRAHGRPGDRDMRAGSKEGIEAAQEDYRLRGRDPTKGDEGAWVDAATAVVQPRLGGALSLHHAVLCQICGQRALRVRSLELARSDESYRVDSLLLIMRNACVRVSSHQMGSESNQVHKPDEWYTQRHASWSAYQPAMPA
jgi:hypothetical protein